MTEATSSSYTPLLLHIADAADNKKIVLEQLTRRFPDSHSHEVMWINEDGSSISIELVRDVTQMLSFGSYQGATRQVILLSLDKASIQAQNALLKLLEEPPTKTQIWLTSSSNTAVLPTIVSRCQEIVIVSKKNETDSTDTAIIDQIESLSYRELSEYAEKHADKETAQKLVENLIKNIHQNLANQPAHHTAVLQILLQTKLYIDANVNVRLSLENGLFTIKRLSKDQEQGLALSH